MGSRSQKEEVMSIENTAKTDPLLLFAEALGNPGSFIEAQEARGQAQVVASQQLPAKGDWDALEALGFVKGEPVEGDDLFVNATIPEGWYKEPTNHSMWSVIKDERGVERVMVGYKAAFYDRWAQISVKNVPYELVSDLIFGDGEISAPDYWDKLTPAEKELSLAAARERHVKYREDAERVPGDPYWWGQVERAWKTEELLDKLIREGLDGQ